MSTARQLINEVANRQWIKCREGWISYSKLADGRYYITASGQRAQTVLAQDLSGMLRELKQHLGGEVRNAGR